MSEEEFVTVVSVEDAPFVTVVEVEEPPAGALGADESSVEPPPVEEEIQLYRLPGERLGFGLKFDGGPTVLSLTIESTSEGSPSARARASWGPLGPGDGILAVDGHPVAGLTRQEVVSRLTESGLVVRLLIRRGPPPVPPRRQTRRRLPGPPPPPRPLPRAPPRLVDFLPKHNSTQVDSSAEDSNTKYPVTEIFHKIEIYGEQGLISKQEEMESTEVPLSLEENSKDKIVPLKNLNPKLISLFEYSNLSDTNNKTSQLNNNLWKNDDKSRKSVKDKIALFSNESSNRVKKQEFGELTQNENFEKKVQTSQTKLIGGKTVPNKNYLCSKISITNDVDVISDQSSDKIDETINKPLSNNHNIIIEFSKSDPQEDAASNKINKIEDDRSLQATPEKNTVTTEVLQKKSDDVRYCFSNNYIDNKKKPSSIKEKNASKLRGLVIPQNISRVPPAEQILDLPEIKSTNIFPTIINPNEVNIHHTYDKNTLQHSQSFSVNANLNSFSNTLDWKPQIDNEIPKYSPAFKRKALSVFEIRNQFASPQYDGNYPDSLKQNSNNLKNTTIRNSENDLTECIQKPSNQAIEALASPSNDNCNHFMQTECNTNFDRKDNTSLNFEDEESKSDSNTLSCFSNSTENHSKTSSVSSEIAASHSSEYSSQVELEKLKEPLEGKLDSLQSQDMSDSGNHSIPSNYSKSKYDSCDESICSLANGEIRDSDDTSLNSSSDEGHFIEFNYKSNKALNARTNDPEELISETPHEIFMDSIKIDYDAKSVDVNYPEPVSHLDTISSIPLDVNKEIKDVGKTQDVTVIIPKQLNEEQREPICPLNKENEENEKAGEAYAFKLNHSNKISKLRSRDMKVNNDYAIAMISRDYNEDNICALNNPISDLQKDNHFASITSLASSTSLISQQELCQLIEESNDCSLDDSNGSPEISVIVLHRDSAEGSIGITLAGGVDYESKDITVHKVLIGSPADRDGRIKKGHRILSINGKSMKGLTHADSLAVLKAPRHEVVLVVARSQGELFEENNNISHSTQQSPELSQTNSLTGGEIKWGPPINIILKKEGAGLGFSLKGGKDSPSGDQPLTVQKIFTGGCADKSKQLFGGDELISINDFDLNGMTRVEAWTLMKRLPDGEVLLKIRHPAQ